MSLHSWGEGKCVVAIVFFPESVNGYILQRLDMSSSERDSDKKKMIPMLTFIQRIFNNL